MNKLIPFFLFLVCIVAITWSAEYQKFTNQEGKTIVARIVQYDAEGGRVQLQLKSRKKAWIELSSLSEEDQTYIRQTQEEIIKKKAEAEKAKRSSVRYKIKLSSSDIFEIVAPPEWSVKREEYEKNEKAWLTVKPNDQSFFLNMIFRKVGRKVSRDYLEKTTTIKGQRYLATCEEDTVNLQSMDLDKGCGIFATFTDSNLDESDPGDFKYITIGAIGLSDNIELSFILITHVIGDDLHKELLKYMTEYIK